MLNYQIYCFIRRRCYSWRSNIRSSKTSYDL